MALFTRVIPDKPGTQKGLNNLARRFRADDPRADTEHIHIIVFHALVRRIGIMADTRINTSHLVCSDARAHTRSAQQNRPVDGSILNGTANFFRKIRVIHSHSAVGAKIDGFMYKRRTNQRRRYGHRQQYTTIEITKIAKA